MTLTQRAALAPFMAVCVLLSFIGVHAANTGTATPPQRFSVAQDDLEAIEPLPSWANLKADYGAVGDGIADDTPALQKALNEMGRHGKAAVLFIPAGTYKITTTLVLRGMYETGRDADWGGVGITGDSPSTTRILWKGPPGEPMLIQDGGYNTRYSRLTWDGNKTAGYGVAHWWDTLKHTYYDGSPEHSDEVFQDMGIGIVAGRLGASYGQMNSEGQVRRVTFLRNWKAGINTSSWNALDWWVWDSRFIDCARGISNVFSADSSSTGAGATHVYRSVFERSTVADVNMGNTMWFSMHNNISLGSRRFFQGEGMGSNGAEVVIQNNRILNTTDPKSIINGNLGPVILIDNEIRSLLNTGPVVQLTDWVPGSDVISVGNKYTHALAASTPDKAPIEGAHKSDRITSIADKIVKPDDILLALPPPPSPPPRISRQVFEVANGANARTIQATIDEAAASQYTNPIIHLPPGKFELDRTLIVPAGARLQIVGDGLTSQLWWKGPASKPMIRLQSPSRATLRDLQMISFNGPSIEIPQADQDGGRILILGTSTGAISATSLRKTQLTMQANPYIARVTLNDATNVVSIGAGGGGPWLTLNNGSSALFADTWYEGPETDLYRLYSGDLTFIGGMLAPATHARERTNTERPTVMLDGYSGKAAFIGFRFDLNELTSGIGIKVDAERPTTKALFLGVYANRDKYFHRSAEMAGQVGLVSSKTVNDAKVSAQAPNQGTTNGDFILEMLQQARALRWDTAPYVAPKKATDIRLYRVKADQTQGLRISGD